MRLQQLKKNLYCSNGSKDDLIFELDVDDRVCGKTIKLLTYL